MATFKGVVKLTEEQYKTLKNDGTITVGDVTLNYDENTLYVTSLEDTPIQLNTEIFTIETSQWVSLNESSPYTFSAQVTISSTLSSNSIVELINDQPVLFATYGFAIGSISGQTATIYSIGQPSESVTLTLGVTG